MNDALTPARAGRLATVDALRGVAAMGVVIYHVYGADAAREMHGVVSQIASHGWLGVPMFFVISGFVIPRSLVRDGRAATFLSRRLVRVGVPLMAAAAFAYLAWEVVASFWSGFRGVPAPALTPGFVACHATATCEMFGVAWLNPVFWTLGIEFQFYALVALCAALSTRAPIWLALTPAVAIMLASPWTSKAFLPAFSMLFALGAWVWWREQCRPVMASAVFVFVSLAILTWITRGSSEAVAGVGTALAISWVRVAPRVLLWLGGISYSIYLIHVPIAGRVVNYLGRGVDASWWRFQVIALLAIGASIACAWLFWRAVEVPALAWSRRLGARAAVA